MKQLISTEFFRTLQMGTDVAPQNLVNGYDEFVSLMFSIGKSATDRDEYHNLLAYTYVELSCLEAETKKKCFCLS